jgi:ParB-like chromosome segregation protein Spo0J
MAKIKTVTDCVMVPLDQISPYWNNPRLNDKTREALADAYREVGFNQPILIDKHNVIVKGHARYHAAVIAGFDEIPCVVSPNGPKANREDRILDNAIQDLSDWDVGKLREEMARIDLEIQHVFSEEHVRSTIRRAGREVVLPVEKELKLVCPKCGKTHMVKQGDLLARGTIYV